MKEIKQPDWCNYPKNELGDATTQALGCWSLLNGNIHSKDDCIKYNCECCIFEPIVFDDIATAMKYINNANFEIFIRKNKLYTKWGRLMAIVNIKKRK